MRKFLALKSFGDTVIACHHLRALASPEDELVCAGHLRSLLVALGYPGAVSWLANGENGVPAFFDIRKHGVWAALKSATRLKRSILTTRSAGDSIVFDRLGWRQRYLAAGMPCEDVVAGTHNIYLDYEAFFGRVHPGVVGCGCVRGVVGIFPDSRIAAKELPEPLVQAVSECLKAAGYDFRVVRAGDGREISTFEGLVETVQSFSGIVSADSLPAHLAEYFGKPSFVFSPAPNPYWLPKSAYLNGNHSIFGAPLDGLQRWILNREEMVA